MKLFQNRDQLRMTEGPIGVQLVSFALPLFIGNLFQQLYNTADALIVGRLLGNDALAAVSATGTLVFLLVSFFGGIAAGAGVAISRYYGARNIPRMRRAIHTNLVLGAIGAVILTSVGVLLTRTFLIWMGTPDDILDGSAAYIRIIFAGSTGMVFYNTCQGMMQAVGDSIHPLKYLIISSLTNIVLDVAFIVIFHGGVESAAFATILSQLFSACLCLRRLLTVEAEYRISPKELALDGSLAAEIVRYGLPSGLQNSVIAIANVVVQSNINDFGKMAVSGCGAYSKIEGFGFLPINSFVIALTTFIGQNLGAANYERAKKGARFGVLCCLGCAEFIGFLLYVFGRPLLKLFIPEEPAAVEFGLMKLHTLTPFFFLLAATHALSAVLRGAGKAVIPMISMLSFWCVIRVSFIRILMPHFHSIAVVNWVYPLTWLLSTIFLIIYYKKADWVHSFVKKK